MPRKTSRLKQVWLQSGECYQMSWIPERLAIVDNRVRIKNIRTWVNCVWTVIKVYRGWMTFEGVKDP